MSAKFRHITQVGYCANCLNCDFQINVPMSNKKQRKEARDKVVEHLTNYKWHKVRAGKTTFVNVEWVS